MRIRYVCKKCRRDFTLLKSLAVHMRSHLIGRREEETAICKEFVMREGKILLNKLSIFLFFFQNRSFCFFPCFTKLINKLLLLTKYDQEECASYLLTNVLVPLFLLLLTTKPHIHLLMKELLLASASIST